MKLTAVVLFFGACLTSALGQAQAAPPPSSAAATGAPQTAAPVKNPVTTALGMLLPRSRNNTLGAITAMPADKFNYKPTPDQMTFAHLVVHIVESNNFLCAKVADVPAPKADEPKESESKDQLVVAVKASYSFCVESLSKMDDSKLGDTV